MKKEHSTTTTRTKARLRLWALLLTCLIISTILSGCVIDGRTFGEATPLPLQTNQVAILPSDIPTSVPSELPSIIPTEAVTALISSEPTAEASLEPTPVPTEPETSAFSAPLPTVVLTSAPTPAAATPTPAPTQSPQQSFTDVPYVDGYTNEQFVNFRREPSTNAGVIRVLTYGTSVAITGKNSEWFRVRHDGDVGYIARPYVTAGSPATPTPTPKPTPAPDQFTPVANVDAFVNRDRVNLRSAPNTSSNVISVLTYGTKVVITGKNSEWFRVAYKNKTGYIVRKYLTVGQPSSPTPPTTPKPDPTAGPTAAPGQFTDYDIHLVAALIHMEAPGSTSIGCRAIASVVYNRVLNKSGKFPNTVKGVLLQSNQFGNRPLSQYENTNPNATALAAAEYVFRTHGSTLPEKVLFYRAASLGTDWYDFTVFYKTIEANNFFYGINFF